MKWYTNPMFWTFIVFLVMCVTLLSGCGATTWQGFAEYKADLFLRNWLTSIGPLIR